MSLTLASLGDWLLEHPIHWFIEHTPELGAAGTLASAALALAVVWLTAVAVQHNSKMVKHNSDMVEEMRQERLERTRPLILLNFAEVDDVWDFNRVEQLVVLTIRNYGGPVTRVSFKFDPPLINPYRQDIGNFPPLGSELPLLEPGALHRVKFARYKHVYSIPFYLQQMPTHFHVTIQSHDPTTGLPLPPTTMALNLATLAPYPFPGKIFTAALSSGKWPPGTTLTTLEGEDIKGWETVLGKLTRGGIDTGICESQSNLGSGEFTIKNRGWHVMESGQDHDSHVLAIKERQPHVGTIVNARGWDKPATYCLVLAKILDIEHQGQPS